MGRWLALLLAGVLVVAVGASDNSPFAASTVQAKGKSGAGGGYAKNDAKMGKGKGKGGKLANWASNLRGQVPAMFDDKAAQKIFDNLPMGNKKPKPTVDEYRSKGWHYQIKKEKATSQPVDDGSSFPKNQFASGSAALVGSSAKDIDTKANKSPKMDITDPETIRKDEEKYAKMKQWREDKEKARKVRMCRRIVLRPSHYVHARRVGCVRRYSWCSDGCRLFSWHVGGGGASEKGQGHSQR